MIKVQRIRCLISEGVHHACEREKHESSEMERTRELLSHDRHNIVSQISFPDKRKFEAKQTDGHAGWKFSSPIGTERNSCPSFRAKKTLLLSNKCRLFLKSACRQGGGVTTEVLNPRVNKASVLMFQLCKRDCAVIPRSWMRWSGGEVSPQLWSTPS